MSRIFPRNRLIFDLKKLDLYATDGQHCRQTRTSQCLFNLRKSTSPILFVELFLTYLNIWNIRYIHVSSMQRYDICSVSSIMIVIVILILISILFLRSILLSMNFFIIGCKLISSSMPSLYSFYVLKQFSA